MDEIIGQQYLERFRAGHRNTGFIKIITDMRRVGRSVLMKQYIEDLCVSGVLHDDVLFIDFESVDSQNICIKDDLNRVVKEKVPADHMFYVFSTRYRMPSAGRCRLRR